MPVLHPQIFCIGDRFSVSHQRNWSFEEHEMKFEVLNYFAPGYCENSFHKSGACQRFHPERRRSYSTACSKSALRCFSADDNPSVITLVTNTKSEIIFDVSRFLLPSTVSLCPFEATSPEGDGVVNLVAWGCLMMIITCGRYSVVWWWWRYYYYYVCEMEKV